jgi:hypothetical protein
LEEERENRRRKQILQKSLEDLLRLKENSEKNILRFISNESFYILLFLERVKNLTKK